ncbi:MAG: SMP-30/gluconolactonase/LRE family protein [Acidobacteriaceae bacterium]
MKVLRLAPSLDRLIAPGTEPEVVSGGYVFTEGPMWRGGRLWFSDEEGGKVHAITPDGKDTVLTDFSQGPYARPHGQKTGPNAMATSKDGSVAMCEQYGRAVVRLIGESGAMKPIPFFDSYEGRRLNSPNDLVFLPDGSFFFTDPPYGLKGGDHDPAKQLSFDGVFHYKDGKLTPIIKDLTLPNGIALSPDNRTLYVNNSGPAERVIAYSLHSDGSVGMPHNVIEFTGKEGPGVPDGMKIDSRGDIWTTGPGGIRIITPQGKVLGQIILPEVAANLAWGGDGSTLYITARTHIYRLHTLVQGYLPAFHR